MKNNKLMLLIGIILMVSFSACEKGGKEETTPQVMQKELPHYDESNSKGLAWDQLPEELKNATPISELEQSERSSYYAVGPWGGNGGSSFSCNPSSSTRIYAMAIRSGSRIDRLVIWYKASNGTIYVGCDKGGNGGSYYYQSFSTGEIITRINGRSGSRIDRLSVYTNKKSFTYGGNGGRPFTVSVPSGYHILGFYGRSGSEIDNIGFYVHNL